ncbi:MAG: YbdD/YjiX family protein [Gemmatimonadales bacterium]|nr:YbdD/YjiX family protein [Gemmatimonadales bacterium]
MWPDLSRAAALLRRIAGMPDYGAHVAHLRRAHPDRPVPTRKEFFDEYLRTRYADGPTRCC